MAKKTRPPSKELSNVVEFPTSGYDRTVAVHYGAFHPAVQVMIALNFLGKQEYKNKREVENVLNAALFYLGFNLDVVHGIVPR